MKEFTGTILAIGAMSIVGGALFLMFFQPIPDANTQTLGIVIGFVGGYASAAYQYHFGSSKGSDDKNSALNTLASKVTGDGKEHDDEKSAG